MAANTPTVVEMCFLKFIWENVFPSTTKLRDGPFSRCLGHEDSAFTNELILLLPDSCIQRSLMSVITSEIQKETTRIR